MTADETSINVDSVCELFVDNISGNKSRDELLVEFSYSFKLHSKSSLDVHQYMVLS